MAELDKQYNLSEKLKVTEIFIDDTITTESYGKVIFKGFDYFMGQQTIMLKSNKYNDTFYPLPEVIEAEGFKFLNLTRDY